MTGKMRHTRGKLRYFLDGKEVGRARYNRAMRAAREAHHVVPKTFGHWPMASEAMGVHPKSIGKAIEKDRALGAPPTNYDTTGRPIWTSPGHKKAFCKAHGVHDRNSYS